jgi:2-hydroxychromene-2-carboxylate isomerase
MAIPSAPILFYFDYVSPNAYLAWRRLPELAARHEAAIEPVPVLFVGLPPDGFAVGGEAVARAPWRRPDTPRLT